MVATRSSGNNKLSKPVKVTYSRSISMSRRSQIDEYVDTNDGSNDEGEVIKRRRTRSTSRMLEEPHSPSVTNGNSDDEFPSRRFNGNTNPRKSSEFDPKYPSSPRHPQVDADLMKKKQRDNISHSRSLRSLGLDEEGSSCEEEDGIGALATTCRPRSASRESFPNMLLRRSSRKKKTIYSTLNVSTIEHAAMLPDEIEHVEHVTRKRTEKQRSIKPELRDLLIAQGKKPEDIVELSQPDIYSSIKSRRRERRRRRFFDEEDCNAHPQDHEHSDNSDEDQPEGEKDEDAEHEEDEEEDDDDDDEEEENEVVTRRKYSLRTKRAQPLRLVYEIQRQPRQTPREIFDHLPSSPVHRRRRRVRETAAQHSASPYQQRQRRTNSQGASSSTGSSTSDDDEAKFNRRKKKSMTKARNRCLPMNLTLNDLAKHGFANERRKIGSSLADVDPMHIDKSVKFSSVGGHRKHVRALKEMVVFPLLYPEVFEKFNFHPPRGCLFYGPPGTGKTLMARALANECSTEGKKVAFFMRKGADCLSKWVGESERQLRLLFDQAYQMRPSIIFFDEIDGLAPVRSSRQDQIHSSIVSTLLGLMDGLDNRGEIIVIGATNRIDSIDPALRRPGRFDREFLFPLPDKKARRDILGIHTRKWSPPPTEALLDELAEKTVGYCGADIMALCGESALSALRRRYPQIYESSDKLQLNIDSINIQMSDFYKAMQTVVPAAHRSAASPGHALHSSIRPLLLNTLRRVLQLLAKLYPIVHKKSKLLKNSEVAQTSTPVEATSHISDSDSEFDEDESPTMLPLPLNGLSIDQSLLKGISSYAYREFSVHRPRMLMCGDRQSGQTTHLAPAVLHDLEGVHVHLLDIPALYGTSARTPEEACAQIFREARRTSPSIVFMPQIPMWWESASPTVRHTFQALLRTLPPYSPVAIIATADCLYEDLAPEIMSIFSQHRREVFVTSPPSKEERTVFFAPIFLQFAIKPPVNKLKKQMQSMEVLEKAPSPKMVELTEKELQRIELEEENTMRSLRLFLRDVLTRLAQDRRFKVFLKPVDTEEVPDYTEVIDQPMDISTMMNKIDQHKYNNVASFLIDINLICSNALEYNPDHCAEDRAIRHRACLLKDIAHAIVQEDLDPNFEKLCNEVTEARRKRNANPLKFAPAYTNVLPKPRSAETGNSENDHHKPSRGLKREDSGRSSNGAPRRKRRRSTWASGVIRKIKKKARIEDESDGDANPDEEPTIEDGGLDSGDDDSVSKRNTVIEDEDDSNAASGDTESDDEDVGVQNGVGPAGDATANPENSETEEVFCQSSEASGSPGGGDLKKDFDYAEDKTSKSDESSGYKEKMQDEEQMEEESGDSAPNPSTPGESEKQTSSGAVESQEDVPMEESNPSSSASSSASHGNRIDEVNEVEPIENEDSKEFQTVCKMTLRSRSRPCKEEEELPVVEPIRIPSPPPLVVDEQKLRDLLHHTVQITSSWKVEELERLYSSLSRCIYRHRHDYDKTSLEQELAVEVKSLSTMSLCDGLH